MQSCHAWPQRRFTSSSLAHVQRTNIPPRTWHQGKKEPHPHVFIYSMRSARSFSFFIPAKTILVPGIYFFGLTRYSYMCLSDHMIPEFLFASEYAKPSSVPDW